MKRQDVLDGLDLQNHFAVHDDVCSVPAFQPDAIIDKRQTNLLFVWKAGLGELVAETVLIGRFQQARSEAGVHSHRQADYLMSEGAAMGKGHSRNLERVGFAFINRPKKRQVDTE